MFKPWMPRIHWLITATSSFCHPNNTIYLDGNSLGALPRRVQERVRSTTEIEWGQDLITSWNQHEWVSLPSKVGDKISPLIGVSRGTVVCCDSISVNVFKLLGAAMMTIKDNKHIEILSSQDNFPTDLYVAQGLQSLLGSDRCQFVGVPEDDLLASIRETTAVVMVTQVNFRTGKILDIPALTKKAHECGALILVDLAHSAGVLPMHLEEWNVDMAVGCTYKYLNGGPGGPAFLYVNPKLNLPSQPLSGWFGHSAPFSFDPKYQPHGRVQKFLVGTPSIISMSAVDAALDIYQGLDLEQVRQKSMKLTTLFHNLLCQFGLTTTLELVSPTKASERGSQLSYSFEYAYELCQALIARKVIADFRAPDVIRFGFAPLYTTYQDIWHAVQHAQQLLDSKGYLTDPAYSKRQTVT